MDPFCLISAVQAAAGNEMMWAHFGLLSTN